MNRTVLTRLRYRLLTASLLGLLALHLSSAQAPLPVPAAASATASPPSGEAQDVLNTPGHFDFYLLDLPWGPVFCASIKDVSAGCKPQNGFVVHGLWPQNADGTWPQFCAKTPPPPDLAQHLTLTPDLQLLRHEWDKHGTCSGLSGEAFFAAEHTAFAQLTMPVPLIEITPNRTFTPLFALNMFYLANPELPPGSLSLSCRSGHVTALEACFSKDLRPIRCQGLQSCNEQIVTFDLLPPPSR